MDPPMLVGLLSTGMTVEGGLLNATDLLLEAGLPPIGLVRFEAPDMLELPMNPPMGLPLGLGCCCVCIYTTTNQGEC